jgi:hypothetical protein
MSMESLTTGTLAGTGSFRCEACGYVLTLEASDQLPPCPGCSGEEFVRASLFGTRFRRDGADLESEAALAELDQAAAEITEPGEYLVFEESGQVRVAPLRGDWTRIGRSLAADVRLDDPTISRRHALVVRDPDGVRVLDDRSLNGVFVNGERVEWHALTDGDEIVVGRYRLHFRVIAADRAAHAQSEEASG